MYFSINMRVLFNHPMPFAWCETLFLSLGVYGSVVELSYDVLLWHFINPGSSKLCGRRVHFTH